MESTGKEVAEYGGWLLFLGMVAKDIFPIFATRIFPSLARKQQAEEERQRMELEAEIAAAKDEREHRHEMERRSVEAMENQTTILQSIKDFMVSINDRVGALENAVKHPPIRKSRKASRA